MALNKHDLERMSDRTNATPKVQPDRESPVKLTIVEVVVLSVMGVGVIYVLLFVDSLIGGEDEGYRTFLLWLGWVICPVVLTARGIYKTCRNPNRFDDG